jgi:hypothetical protein
MTWFSYHISSEKDRDTKGLNADILNVEIACDVHNGNNQQQKQVLISNIILESNIPMFSYSASQFSDEDDDETEVMEEDSDSDSAG